MSPPFLHPGFSFIPARHNTSSASVAALRPWISLHIIKALLLSTFDRNSNPIYLLGMPRMPAAIDTGPTSPTQYAIPETKHADVDDADLPERPPISPITPTATFAQPKASAVSAVSASPADDVVQPPSGEATFITRPAPLPIGESSNVDAMALKSAISVLQVQKQKSKNDLQTLQQLREAASQNPGYFAEQLMSGNLKHEPSPGNPLQATFESSIDDEDDLDGQPAQESSSQALPKFPTPQNVFRCPPVNWAEYHVVGESLDKIHEDQIRRPPAGEPFREEAREHVVAAPYSPFLDKHPEQSPMQTRRGFKK